MEAATLNCPMCGAPSASDAPLCEHCGARLAVVACPSCFAMVFLGSKFCQHCGAKIVRSEGTEASPKKCPHCRDVLKVITLGLSQLHECPTCQGLWIDVSTFNDICADREKQAAVIGAIPVDPAQAPLNYNLNDIRYVPCPICEKLMNRVNFAHGSGIILDICKAHGVWFDPDELRRIVEFIRGGGLEQSRIRDREIWQEEKRSHALTPPFIVASSEANSLGLNDPVSDHSAASDFLGFIGRGFWELLR